MSSLRNSRTLVLAGALAACLAPACAAAQGFFAAATKDGTDAWVAGDGGVVWRSLDGGATFTAAALGTKTLRAIAARGFTVLVAGDSGQVWRSADDGGTWTLRTVPGLVPVRALAFASGTRAFLAGDGGLLMRSDDGGATWTPLPAGTAQRLNALVFTDEQHGWAAGAAGTLLQTGDGGASWSPVALGTPAPLLTLAASGASVWVGGAGAGCWRSTTGGAPFSFVDLGLELQPDVAGIVATSASDVWIAGGGGFVRHSTDGGASWTWPVHDLHGPVGGIAFAGGKGVVALASARIVARWSGAGSLALPASATVTRSWTQQLVKSSSLIRGNTLAVNPRARSTAWAVIGNLLYRSRDDGETWSSTNSVLGQSRANALVIWPPDTSVFLMAAVTAGGSRQVLRSVNSGVSWSVPLTHVFGEYGVPLELHPDKPDTLLFGGENDFLLRSIDGGLTWNPFGSTVFRSPCDLVITPGDESRLVVADGVTGSGHAKLWQSTNAGASFSLRDSVPGSEVPSLSVSRHRATNVFATTWSAIGASGSLDGGVTWAPLPDLNQSGAEVAATWGTDIARDDPGMVLVGTFSGGLSYLSLDGGQTFTSLALGNSNYAFLARDRACVLALQSDGIWKLRAAYAYTPAAGAPSLALTSPNGGEVWDSGTAHDVTWTAANLALARIEWRASPSDPWHLVADVDGYLGTYAWTVPPVPTGTAEVRVRDAWDGSPSDVSNSTFTIAAYLGVGSGPPAAFALAPIAPTPLLAGARAQIVFDVPRAARVAVELFDVQGQRTATLADGTFEPGRHALALATGDLHAGVYFVRMRAGAFTATRRVLVLR